MPNAARARRSAPKRTAVYAGSFDPVTAGHMYLIREAARLFDRLIVAIGTNPGKHYTFSVDERHELLARCVRGIPNVAIDRFSNDFLVEYAKRVKARYIVRGIRNAHDYEYERTMRQVNGDINPAVTTVFLMPPRELAELSSSFVKGLVGPKGWEKVVKDYLPPPVYKAFLARFRKKGHRGHHEGGLLDMTERS